METCAPLLLRQWTALEEYSGGLYRIRRVRQAALAATVSQIPCNGALEAVTYIAHAPISSSKWRSKKGQYNRALCQLHVKD